MRELKVGAAAAMLAVMLIAGANTMVGGANPTSRDASEPKVVYSRRNPIVDAVEKTRDGIITLKVARTVSWGTKEVIGTGVIVDERGYAVTNAHVVSDAQSVVVTFSDNTTARVEVVAEDTRYDLAILKIPGRKKLKALPFAPGSDLLVGETVIAVGNPYGYSGTVSSGLISAVGREITMPSRDVLANLTQHTAALNPGNSGGPLFNINGELIGINVALREGAQGIGFALNSDTVQRWLSRNLSAAKISKVSHGLECRELVKGKGEDRQKVVVHAVTENSPAARAGLKKGDLIVAVAGRSVTNRFDLERSLWDTKAGEKIEAAVLREGKPSRLAMTLSGGTISTVAASR